MRVNELFVSVQGEGLDAGRPCTFVRFTACNLRCSYCDTSYAFYEGDDVSLDKLVEAVTAKGVGLVCITGGEPLLQPDLVPFIEQLLERKHEIIIETGGHMPVDGLPSAVKRVIDVKTPGALQTAPSEAGRRRFLRQHFHYANLSNLKDGDQLKFVLCDRSDYEWARDFINEHELSESKAIILFSPVHPGLSPDDLVRWMLEDGVPARLNLQLHKYVWGAEVRGV